jgi:hypothetical protein
MNNPPGDGVGLEEVVVMAHRRYFTALREIFEKYKHQVGHAGDEMIWSSSFEPLCEKDWLAFVKKCEEGRGGAGAAGEEGAATRAAETLGGGRNGCDSGNEVPPPIIPGQSIGTQELLLVCCFFLGVFAVIFSRS